MASSTTAAAVLVREHNALVSLPEICVRLRDVLADPQHRRRHVAEVILHDPALSARLLRIVNSAYYGLPAPVRDISQALGIIGEQELNNLAMATALVRNLSTLQPGFELRQFWKASIFAATLARNLSDCCPGARKEELFLAGLLLDIGKLLLYIKEPVLHGTVLARMQESALADHAVERELLGFDHCDVGAALAMSWNFSAELQSCIACHHQLPFGGDHAGMPELLYAVSWFRDRMALDSPTFAEADFLALAPPQLDELLHVDRQQLAWLLACSLDGYRQAYDVFCGGH
jgi:HD-like signal output (HDOD) protein